MCQEKNARVEEIARCKSSEKHSIAASGLRMVSFVVRMFLEERFEEASVPF